LLQTETANKNGKWEAQFAPYCTV